MARVRLDALLADRGLLASRSRAAAAIMAGDVRVAVGGRPVEVLRKPGAQVPVDAHVELSAPPPYVSRGGIKLAGALDALGVDAGGRRALDVGASTGGFTDCLLQRGASAVVALDVGYGELAWSLRQDPRVTVLERRNARHLTPPDLPWAPDLVVADVSFISLTKVLPALAGVLAAGGELLLMVKPQFEVGRAQVGGGGVVRDPALRRRAVADVAAAAAALGLATRGCAWSPLAGPRGNRECFLRLAPGPEGDADVAAALDGADRADAAALDSADRADAAAPDAANRADAAAHEAAPADAAPADATAPETAPAGSAA